MDAYFEWRLAYEQAGMFVISLLLVIALLIVGMMNLYNECKNWWARIFPYMRHYSSSSTSFQARMYRVDEKLYPWMMKWEHKSAVPICPWASAPLWMRIVAKKYK